MIIYYDRLVLTLQEEPDDLFGRSSLVWSSTDVATLVIFRQISEKINKKFKKLQIKDEICWQGLEFHSWQAWITENLCCSEDQTYMQETKSRESWGWLNESVGYHHIKCSTEILFSIWILVEMVEETRKKNFNNYRNVHENIWNNMFMKVRILARKWADTKESEQ